MDYSRLRVPARALSYRNKTGPSVENHDRYAEAVRFVRAYQGEFQFLRDMKRVVNESPYPLSAKQLRGILNSIDARKQAAA